MKQLLKSLWPGEQAESLSEYALVLLLVSMTAVSAMGSFASAITGFYSGASTRVAAARSDGALEGASLGFGSQAHTGTLPLPRLPKGTNDE